MSKGGRAEAEECDDASAVELAAQDVMQSQTNLRLRFGA